jgi:hypothetical protein
MRSAAAYGDNLTQIAQPLRAHYRAKTTLLSGRAKNTAKGACMLTAPALLGTTYTQNQSKHNDNWIKEQQPLSKIIEIVIGIYLIINSES